MINNESRYINAISNSTYANVNVNWTAVSTNKKIGKYGDYFIGEWKDDKINGKGNF